MKLLSSFFKELKIASRGFYFYIELVMALLIVAIFLFAIPDNFNKQSTEYLYLDMPLEAKESYLQVLQNDQPEVEEKSVKITINDQEKELIQYCFQDKRVNFIDSRQDAEYLADKKGEFVTIISLDPQQELFYEYLLQGFESSRYKNLLKILHIRPQKELEETFNQQDIRSLSRTISELSDKENLLPSVLVFNGALMGMFLIAAYIFLDRQEGVIKALALTPLAVWQYLLSKIGIILVTSIVSSLVIVFSVMQFEVPYGLLLALLVSSTFFSSTVGLYLASFYQNIMQAFGVFYLLMMVMIVPNIAYFIPSWNPAWLKWIPSYYMLEGFKAVLIKNSPSQYVLLLSFGFLAVGLAMFILANDRYKKTLLK